MEIEKQEEIIETPTSEVIEQDPLKEELEKVRTGRTEEEKAAFTFQKQAERLTALGIDPANVLGIKKATPSEAIDDDAPVTVGMWKKLQEEQASKTALQLADDITGETERELVKYHLQNTIRSTGNPTKDLELASNLVNAVKNKQVIEEIARKTPAKVYSSPGGGTPHKEQEPELTKEELKYMGAPFNLSKQSILDARKKAAENKQ